MLAYLHSSNFLFRDKEGIGLGVGVGRKKDPPKEPPLSSTPLPQECPSPKDPSFPNGKNDPRCAPGARCLQLQFHGELFGRYVKSESYLLTFDMTPLGE